MKADLGELSNYDAYLGIVPGEFLVKIYYDYGSKLLQGNVRAFLSFRGNVNKGIRSTIMKQPENFFTYNNGIAIVARSVRFSADGTKITYFKDLQIINGGQTTAALASAIIKNEAPKGMDNLFVPMKLTVLNVDDDMSEEQVRITNKVDRLIEKAHTNGEKISENRIAILRLMEENPYISKVDLGKKLGLHPSSVWRNIETMRGKFLRRVGPDKGGFWEIILEGL